MSPPKTQRYLSQKEIDEIHELKADCIARLTINPAAPAAEILETLDSSVRGAQRNAENYEESWREEISLMMGSLWGDTLVDALGWDWLFVESQNGRKTYCVASADRSLCIYPFDFSRICIDKPNVDITIALAFNMLVAGMVVNESSDGFLNVMGAVRHIVPPE